MEFCLLVQPLCTWGDNGWCLDERGGGRPGTSRAGRSLAGIRLAGLGTVVFDAKILLLLGEGCRLGN